jgi:hypothetical protein
LKTCLYLLYLPGPANIFFAAGSENIVPCCNQIGKSKHWHEDDLVRARDLFRRPGKGAARSWSRNGDVLPAIPRLRGWGSNFFCVPDGALGMEEFAIKSKAAACAGKQYE